MSAAQDAAKNSTKQHIYRCFLLRCQAMGGAVGCANGQPKWRFTVQEAGPEAARRTFVCLKDLEAFLEIEFGQDVDER